MKINIFHTNDIHSNYDFLKKVHLYIRQNKKENDIYLDSGDFLDVSNLLVEGDGGISAMEVFMDTKLDGMTIGNNEIDLGLNNLENLMKEDFPIISSNLYSDKLKEIKNLKRSIIIERQGIKFLILGVCPYFSNDLKYSSYNAFYNLNDLEATNPIEELKKEFDRYEGQYDYVIFLSHSGHIVDEYLKNFFDFDVILGGHTHIIVSKDNYTMSGRGQTLGKIVIDVDKDSLKILENVQIELQDVENERFDTIFEEKLNYTKSLLSEDITLYENLEFDPFSENRLINFLCDALYKHYDADLAIMHNGISQGSINKTTSKMEIHELFPSKLNPTIFPVKGRDLKFAILQSLDDSFIRQSGHGAGFRGNILGTLGYSHNVKISLDPILIKINGVELDEDKIYKVVSDDYLQRGTCYESLRTFEDVKYDKYFIRDFIMMYLQDREIYESSKIKRVYNQFL